MTTGRPFPSELAVSPVFSGVSVALGYAVGGMIPLLPYFFAKNSSVALATRWSIAMSMLALFVFARFMENWVGAGWLYYNLPFSQLEPHVPKALAIRLFTIALGVIGSLLSAIGIANGTGFQNFLTEIGVLFPPIAAIMIADYFVLKTWRPELDASRAQDTLPTHAPEWVPAGLLAWAVAYAISSPLLLGKLVTVGVPSINALVADAVIVQPEDPRGFLPGAHERALDMWRDVLIGDVAAESAPGDHFTLLSGEHAGTTARALVRGLRVLRDR